jgi:hypothetical protein
MVLAVGPHDPVNSSAIAISWDTAPGRPHAAHSRWTARVLTISAASTDLSRRQALDSLQPPQVAKGDDRRLLASKTDHLVRPTRIRSCWLRCHASRHDGTR